MKMTAAREMLAVIHSEERKRLRRVRRLDAQGHEFAWEIYKFECEPFVADLCLSLLTVVWHKVERDLLRLAARLGPIDQPISSTEYLQAVQVERKEFRNRRTKPQVLQRLNVSKFPAWTGSLEALRLLVNCYKHDPNGTPDAALLRHLRLPQSPGGMVKSYARLSESDAFREGLARFLGLKGGAGYPKIASAFIVEAEHFLALVSGQPIFRPYGHEAGALSSFVG